MKDFLFRLLLMPYILAALVACSTTRTPLQSAFESGDYAATVRMTVHQFDSDISSTPETTPGASLDEWERLYIQYPEARSRLAAHYLKEAQGVTELEEAKRFQQLVEFYKRWGLLTTADATDIMSLPHMEELIETLDSMGMLPEPVIEREPLWRGVRLIHGEVDNAQCEFMLQKKCGTSIGAGGRCTNWHLEQAERIGANGVKTGVGAGRLNPFGLTGWSYTLSADYYRCTKAAGGSSGKDFIGGSTKAVPSGNLRNQEADEDFARLRKLKEMYEQGLIDQSEYTIEKQKVLDSM